jgi:hydrogenase-4 component F
MGGAVAAFAGLLHMTVHSLTKSAIFFTVGHAAQKTGTQNMDEIRGLIERNPTIGWGLALGTLAILGVPPFGVFASEFMILTTAMHEHAWSTPFLLLALAVAFAAVFGKVQPMVFGETTARRLPHQPALLPVFVHLALVLMLGLYIPPYLEQWYRQAAALIGNTVESNFPDDLRHRATPIPGACTRGASKSLRRSCAESARACVSTAGGWSPSGAKMTRIAMPASC